MFLPAVLPRFAITSVEFLVARQVVGSVVIRAAKLKMLQKVELESTLRNLLPQLTALYFAARQVGHKSGNTRNRVFQIAMLGKATLHCK